MNNVKYCRATHEASMLKAYEKHRPDFPKGFDPVFNYPNGKDPQVVKGVVTLRSNDFNNFRLRFEADINDPITLPALPILASGEAWHAGWDIPTRWAIDADKSVWLDAAHGGSLCRESIENLLLAVEEDPYARGLVHKALGIVPPIEGWEEKALAAGWAPPKKE